MPTVLEIAVVGGGTAGAAAALFLSRAGHRVTLFERVPAPAAIGAGIVLQPTGQMVLARLGLLDEIAARSERIDRLLCRTARGRTVIDLSYASVDPSLHGRGLHRGVLFDALFSACRAEVDLRCGVEIVAVERRISKIGLAGATARDRRALHLVDDGGDRHGPFELVIAADGARSRLRATASPVTHEGHVRRYPWGALWFLARDPERTFRGGLFQVVSGARQMLGFLPTGLAARGGPDADIPVTSIYWSLRETDLARVRRAPIEAWKKDVRSLLVRASQQVRDDAEALLAQIRTSEDLLFAGYADVETRPLGAEGLVFLGDAAHAMSPQLGQGCNLALLDALVLAECVHAIAEPTPEAIDRALAIYDARRRSHLRVYGQATRWLTPFFQGDAAILGTLRDLGMGPVAAIPFARRMMTTSMAGILAGWHGGTIALPTADDDRG
jgi:2-polyprenyl-6-methoxyphenol hydroxylase-like FAD-dependent oxidoreductase